MQTPAPSPRQTATLLAHLLRDHATADELPAVEALASAAAGADAAALRDAHRAVAPIVERLQCPAPPPSGTRRTGRRSADADLVDDLRAATDRALDAVADVERATVALDATLARVSL